MTFSLTDQELRAFRGRARAWAEQYAAITRETAIKHAVCVKDAGTMRVVEGSAGDGLVEVSNWISAHPFPRMLPDI